MSYDNEALVKIIQAAKEALAEIGLELAPPGYGADLKVDFRSEEERGGTEPQHTLVLVALWDGTIPEALRDPLADDPTLDPEWDPNAEAGDDAELTDEERALFASLDPNFVVDDDDTLHDLEKKAEDAQASDVVANFLKLRNQHGGGADPT